MLRAQELRVGLPESMVTTDAEHPKKPGFCKSRARSCKCGRLFLGRSARLLGCRASQTLKVDRYRKAITRFCKKGSVFRPLGPAAYPDFTIAPTATTLATVRAAAPNGAQSARNPAEGGRGSGLIVHAGRGAGLLPAAPGLLPAAPGFGGMKCQSPLALGGAIDGKEGWPGANAPAAHCLGEPTT